MRLFLAPFIVVSALVVSAVIPPGHAEGATVACAEGGSIPPTYKAVVAGLDSAAGQLNLSIVAGPSGKISLGGVLILHAVEWGVPEIFTPEELLNISCQDANSDGIAGVVFIEVALRSLASGERVVAAVIPESEVVEIQHYFATVRLSGGARELSWVGRPIIVTDLSDPR